MKQKHKRSYQEPSMFGRLPAHTQTLLILFTILALIALPIIVGVLVAPEFIESVLAGLGYWRATTPTLPLVIACQSQSLNCYGEAIKAVIIAPCALMRMPDHSA